MVVQTHQAHEHNNQRDYGVTRIEHKDGYKNITTKSYTKQEQDIKKICSYFKNDIKYFMKQCQKPLKKMSESYDTLKNQK